MPMYSFKCDDCGHADTEFFSMQGVPPSGECVGCPRCPAHAYRRLVDLPHTDLKEFHTPIEMYSIAMDDDAAIKEFKQRCPDVDVSMDQADPMYGIPVARCRKQKMDALASEGFRERN